MKQRKFIKYNLLNGINAILDLRLYQLTEWSAKIDAEYAEFNGRISELTEIIENERKLLDLIKTELLELKDIYGDERKTIITEAEGDVSMEDSFLMTAVLLL